MTNGRPRTCTPTELSRYVLTPRRRTRARMRARSGRWRRFAGAPPGLMKSSLNRGRVGARICAEAWQPDESSRTSVTRYRSNFGLLGCTLACTPDTVGVKLPDTACHSCGEERSSNSFTFRVFRVCRYVFTFFSFLAEDLRSTCKRVLLAARAEAVNLGI